MSPAPPRAGRRPLVYRLGSLGDTVIALPAFHAIREAFPNSPITLLTNHPINAKAPPVADILGERIFFDHLIRYPVGTRNPVTLARLIGRIRSLRIDTAINLAAFRSPSSTRRDHLFFRAAGARHFIGFSEAAADGHPKPDPATGELEWEAARLARRVAKLADIDLADDRWWDLRLTPAEHARAAELTAALPPHQPIIALGVGTKVQAKDWGAPNWLALTRRLAASCRHHSLLLVGAPDERPLADQCARLWPGPSANICGDASPRASAAALARCAAFAGHDSGPMHLAACVGVRCVAIFSARGLPSQWFPRGTGHRILYHRTDCAGCGLDICIAHNRKCLAAISVDDAERAVRSLLDQPPPSAHRPAIPQQRDQRFV